MKERKDEIPDLEYLKQLQGADFSLHPFFELSHDVLCIAGFDGYFRKVNPAFEKLMGYSAEELYSRPVNDFIHKEDQQITSKGRENLRNNQPLLNFENRYVRRSGELLWLSWTSIPVHAERLVYAIAKDITHLKKLEEERNLLLERLSKANRDLKLLTYSTSHDLRSPVANLQMVFNLLDFSKIQDQETLEILESMEMATESLKQTLNDYQDAINLEDATEVEMEDIDMTGVFRQVSGSIDALIKGSQTVFKFDFADFEAIRFNRIYMESIFLNFITNSIKYSKPGIIPEVYISTKWKDGKKQLIFKDNGRGFDATSVKGKLFSLGQKFTDHADSKGIGLYLVNSHVQSMGGTIDVESEIGNGATFTITSKD